MITPEPDHFMQGYTRTPEMTEELIIELRNVLTSHPQMRLGQLMINAVGPMEMFNIYDEEIIQRLRHYT